MKILNLLTLGTALLSFQACRKDTPDGRVPEKYVADAQIHNGTYTGTMEGATNSFTFRVANNGTASLDFGRDVVGRGCNTDVGQMTSVWATSKKVGGATFAINTQCDILGTKVDVDFKKNGKVNVSIVKDSYETSHQECDTTDWCDDQGHCHSHRTCHMVHETAYTYLTGEFHKN